jgi:hypothetical protein
LEENKVIGSLRKNKLVKVLALCLALVFCLQQTGLAEVKDLRKEGDIKVLDVLLALVSGYLSGVGVNPAWEAYMVFASTYLVPLVAQKICDAAHIKNPVLRMAVTLAISLAANSYFDMASVSKTAVKNTTDAATEAFIANGGGEVGKQAANKVFDQAINSATDQATKAALQKAQSMFNQAVEKYAQDGLSAAQAAARARGYVFHNFKIAAKRLTGQNSASGVDVKAVREATLKAAAAFQEGGKQAANQVFNDAVRNATDQATKAALSDAQRVFMGTINKAAEATSELAGLTTAQLASKAKNAVASYFKSSWAQSTLQGTVQGLKDNFNQLFNHVASMGPQEISVCLQKAAEGFAYGLARGLLFQALKKHNKYLASFIANAGTMLVAQYLSTWLSAQTGVMMLAENGILSAYKPTTEKELKERLDEQMKNFLREYYAAMAASAVETFFAMAGVKEAGVLFSAGLTNMLQHQNVTPEQLKEYQGDKDRYEQQLAALTALSQGGQLSTAGLTSEQVANLQKLSVLDSEGTLVADAERVGILSRFCTQMINYRGEQIHRAMMSSTDLLVEGLKSGLLSAVLQRASLLTDKPMPGAYFNLFLSTLLRTALIPKGCLFTLPDEIDLGKMPNPVIMKMMPGEKDLSFWNAQMGWAYTVARADVFSMGAARPFLNPDGTFSLSWQRPLDAFYMSRYYGYIKYLEKYGLVAAMDSQVISSLHYQSVSNMRDALNQALYLARLRESSPLVMPYLKVNVGTCQDIGNSLKNMLEAADKLGRKQGLIDALRSGRGWLGLRDNVGGALEDFQAALEKLKDKPVIATDIVTGELVDLTGVSPEQLQSSSGAQYVGAATQLTPGSGELIAEPPHLAQFRDGVEGVPPAAQEGATTTSEIAPGIYNYNGREIRVARVEKADIESAIAAVDNFSQTLGEFKANTWVGQWRVIELSLGRQALGAPENQAVVAQETATREQQREDKVQARAEELANAAIMAGDIKKSEAAAKLGNERGWDIPPGEARLSPPEIAAIRADALTQARREMAIEEELTRIDVLSDLFGNPQTYTTWQRTPQVQPSLTQSPVSASTALQDAGPKSETPAQAQPLIAPISQIEAPTAPASSALTTGTSEIPPPQEPIVPPHPTLFRDGIEKVPGVPSTSTAPAAIGVRKPAGTQYLPVVPGVVKTFTQAGVTYGKWWDPEKRVIKIAPIYRLNGQPVLAIGDPAYREERPPAPAPRRYARAPAATRQQSAPVDVPYAGGGPPEWGEPEVSLAKTPKPSGATLPALRRTGQSLSDWNPRVE